MDLDLQGKVAIVTGGSKGIGRAIALELAREGVDIAIAARTQEQVEQTAKELAEETGRKVIGIRADITSWDDVQNMVDTTVSTFGKVDILINNAAMVGGQVRGNLDEATEKDMMEDLDTKVVGYFRCMKAVVPHMRKQKFGRIISIGGVSARQSTIYGMRNTAVVHMTKTFSDQLGADGITMNVVHPGLTKSEVIENMLESRAESQGITPDEAEKNATQNVAIKRAIEPQELAWLVTYLSSPRAECVTGEVIAAGGGAMGGVHQ
ncbi:MAG: SDR family oxidoreductase [SAR202 cluster bacterium]|jgi:NAD(P)-dependent dehydrogenase (short-subunit alcohol dehydrogenase family)|nr:SDR family oxidoreductase [SAR202 cluster bacterium]MDP6514345.1 SDR family oxidoreductase [SAR202 cluster bacterium]MDP6714213.1 SDR family oxidoreductase [SAR202 cluster bacterium]